MSCCAATPSSPQTQPGCGCGPGCRCAPGCKCCAGGKCGAGCACACAAYNSAACAPSECTPKKCWMKCALTIGLGGILAAMVMYLFEGFWHGNYLMPVYEQTKTLWRSAVEMQSLGGTYALVTIAIGLVISFIFAQNYQGKGVPEGIRFGFYIGLLLGLAHFTAYLSLPITLNLAMLWLFGWLIEGVLIGITLSLTYLAVAGNKGNCSKDKSSCDKEKGDCNKPAGSCGK